MSTKTRFFNQNRSFWLLPVADLFGLIYLGWTSTATLSTSATMTSLTWTLSDISAYSSIKQPYQGHSHCSSALFTFQSNMKAALRALALISRYQCKSACRGSGGTRFNLQTRTWLTSTWSLLPCLERGIMCNKAFFFLLQTWQDVNKWGIHKVRGILSVYSPSFKTQARWELVSD